MAMRMHGLVRLLCNLKSAPLTQLYIRMFVLYYQCRDRMKSHGRRDLVCESDTGRRVEGGRFERYVDYSSISTTQQSARASRIAVFLIRSQTLPPTTLQPDPTGFSDPYVCVQVLAAGEKMAKDMRDARERSNAEAKYSKRDVRRQ